MKQATASYMKFSTELTKYNVNVAIRFWKLDNKYVIFPASDKNLSNSLQMLT